jgi:hypothetical protein
MPYDEDMAQNCRCGPDRKRVDVPAKGFNVGDMVLLDRRNIKTLRPARKLDDKYLGPFQIEVVVGDSGMAQRLKLPPSNGRLIPWVLKVLNDEVAQCAHCLIGSKQCSFHMLRQGANYSKVVRASLSKPTWEAFGTVGTSATPAKRSAEGSPSSSSRVPKLARQGE